MATYRFTEDYILWELDGSKGWAYFAWAVAHEASLHGTGVNIVRGGYIKAERDRILKQNKNDNGRRKNQH
jgi:hypothetical protein